MKTKPVRSLVLIIVVLALVVCSFGGGALTGYLVFGQGAAFGGPPRIQTTPVSPTEAGTPASLAETFAPFWEAWDLIHQMYVDQPLDDNALMEGAIRGMMEALNDPYSGYWDVRETQDANNAMSGEYDGIGAYVDTGGEYLTIINPIPGTPAEAAGLRPGDQIIAVDGEDVTGVDPDLVRLTRVMGPAGTDVTLTIRREGVDEPFDVTITRAHIVIPSVSAEMLDNNIAYVQISIFGDDTDTELHNALREVMANNPTGLILDLRNNGGGYLNVAVNIVSEFIPNGVILYEVYGDGSRRPYEAHSGGLATQIPMVVLVNEYSASASEIVAGALQDYGRATLVGTTTFGKGSVQNWMPLSNGGTLRVTIARWETPNGRSIHGQGIDPDLVVEMTEEDYEAGRDPQLEAAIQILTRP
ncbi:MAG: S41 family peptidase [Anaerolineales bacterium]